MGAKDRIPRDRAGIEQLKMMVREAEATEYIYTNDDKIFSGCAVEFLQSVYKCERLPVKIRVYAAKECRDFEPAPPRPAVNIDLAELARRAEAEIDAAFKEYGPPLVIEHQPSAAQSQDPEPPHRPPEDYVRDGVIEPASNDVVRLKDRYRSPRPPYSSVGY
jgi:hypothetical protein